MYFIFNVKGHVKISTIFSEIDSNDSKHSDKPQIPYGTNDFSIVYSEDQNSIVQSLIKAILEEIMEQLLTPSRITSTADTLGWDQIMHEFI